MGATLALLSSEARVATAVPQRYLGQLCKHFRHKLPVELSEHHGRIAFPAGACELDVPHGTELLVLRVTAENTETLARLEEVVASHLARFAFREALEVAWTRAA